jgi:hypothetical protein
MNQSDLFKLKSDIKLDLINYYDSIKFEIDIIAQKQLIVFEKNSPNLKHERENLIVLNKYLIEKIEFLFDSNCYQINEYFSKINDDYDDENQFFFKENVKINALKNYCAFLSNANLKKEFKDRNQIGLLVLTDWYLDENQLKYIK